MAGIFLKRRAMRKSHAMIGLTEHRLDASNRIQVVINHSTHPVRETLPLASGWRLKRVLHGRAEKDRRGITVNLNKNDACVLMVTRSLRPSGDRAM